ncbi:MAG: LTA synthase family protein [Planctomycetaceae bacterium]|nr:LTA synthase family protein [Planctomycetaceae bacterium]
MNDSLTKSALLYRSLCVALLIPFTFACTGLSIFIKNFEMMPGSLNVLLPLLGGLVLLAALPFFLLQLPFLFVKKHWFIYINSLLFACGFLLWMQANVFNWNFGELDGTRVNWAAFRPMMVLELVAYIAVIVLVLWKRQWLQKHVLYLACLLIFMQGVVPATQIPRVLSREGGGWKQYEITYEGFFDYSKEQNVVLIIADAFSSPLFQRMAKRHPEILEWFADFHYFPNQKSQGRTGVSIPQMLTTHDVDARPKRSELVSLWNAEGALLKTLNDVGFQTRVYAFPPQAYHWDPQWISNIRLQDRANAAQRAQTLWDRLCATGIGPLIDLAIVRTSPIVSKPADMEAFSLFQRFLPPFAETKTAYYPLFPSDDVFLTQIIAENPVSANSAKPVLNVIHSRAAHAPYNFNENFERGTMSGIEGEERQALASLRIMKRILDDLKAAGVYDQSHIIIAGDHGTRDSMLLTCVGDESQDHNPLLLIKKQHERHEAMVHHDVYTNVKDVTPTILALLGLENLPGRYSVFEMPTDVLARRAAEYEAFWAEKRENRMWSPGDRNMPTVKMAIAKADTVDSSPVITLKRSELLMYHGKLCWYVGDNPDVWNKTYPSRHAIITMTPTNKENVGRYQGSIRLTMLGNSEREAHYYWFCTGNIDVTILPDGEYEVAFLLPQKEADGYVKNVLGTTVIASGTASIR